MANVGDQLVRGLIHGLFQDFSRISSPDTRNDALAEEGRHIHDFMQRIEQEFNRLSERMLQNVEKGLRENLAQALRQVNQDVHRRNQNRLERLILHQIVGSISGGTRFRFGDSGGQVLADMLCSLSSAARRNL